MDSDTKSPVENSATLAGSHVSKHKAVMSRQMCSVILMLVLAVQEDVIVNTAP